MLRTKGFREVIEAHNAEADTKIEIVATLPGGGDKEPSFRATEDLIQAHAGLNGIFAINDPSALGAIAALEKAGKLAQVKIVGFDGMPEGKQAIKAGKIYADPIQFPDRIGRETVLAIVRHSAGEALPKEQLIPTALYRQADGAQDAALK
jgi:ribose transport system substrate-binding protein